MGGIKLVMGASGFVGSHITRRLVERGDRVRVWLRETSSTAAINDLAVERHYGDLDDAAALRDAMSGVDTVFYSIVDTRAWLRDPKPLYATNVESLRGVLEAALDSGIRRFIFCSTIGTIGRTSRGRADESTPHDWSHLGGPYIDSRLQAERLVLHYARDRGLPAVVLNVSTTYGPRDHGPTPHGQMVHAAARGKVPAYVRGASMEVVGIEDVAEAFLLAEARGRVGERYIISESYMTIRDVLTIAAEAGGASPPRIGLPLGLLAAAGRVLSTLAWFFRFNPVLTPTSVRLMHLMPPLDHAKATRELGWVPNPTADSVRAGVLDAMGRYRQANGSRENAST